VAASFNSEETESTLEVRGELTHPATLGTLRSRTIIWLEVGREIAGSEATKQKCDLVGIKKWRVQGSTGGRVGS